MKIVIKISFIFLLLIEHVSNALFAQFSPSNLSNLQLWLSADNGTTVVSGQLSQWSDQSGLNNSCTQTNSLNRPLFISASPELNNMPCIRFDGTNDLLLGSTISNVNSSSFTIFVVSNGESQSTSIASLFSINTAATGFYFCRRPSLNKFGIFNSNTNLLSSGIFPNTGYTYRILTGNKILNTSFTFRINQNTNFTSNSAGGTSSFVNANYQIGGGNSANFFKGDIAEIIIYGNSLTENEMLQVEQYLMDKYAPPVNLGADINNAYGFCDITLAPQGGYYTNYDWSVGASTSSFNINNPGTYWVAATDVFGRISHDTIVVSRPIFDSIQLQNQLVCFNQVDTITATVPLGSYTFVQWSDGDTNQTRILNQNENISYTVSDSLGCTRTSNLATISIDNSLEYISLGLDTNLCSGNTIQLIQDTSLITDWLWNTGDTTGTIAIDTSGIYDILVSNANGCQNRDTVEVTIIGTSPTLQYSFSDSLCQYIEGVFSDSSFVPNGDGTISNKTWAIGSTLILIGNNGSFLLDSAGIYPVTITVETIEGCNSSETFNLVVNPKPTVSFETQNFCPYDEVQFTANNAAGELINDYSWDFDHNSQTSNLEAPTYTFGESNVYNVELMVEDVNGCRDTTVQEVYIQPAPVAEISIANPCESAPIEITNNSTIADTFSIATYSWNYGDNTGAINPIEEKVYETYGEYEVEVILTANNGCQDTSTQQITVHPQPILNWNIGPACKNSWTTFENASSIPIGSIEQTDWLVNLQYPLDGESAAYEFVTTGIQYLTLTSTSNEGCQKDTLILIDVQSELNSNFNINPINAIAGTPILFTPMEQNAVSYAWSFGNGESTTSSSSASVENVYSEDDIGNLVETFLIVENEIGCVDTSFKYLTINETRVDLSIENLFVQDVNGYLSIGVELKNDGLIDISKIELILNVLNGVPILESDENGLQAGESKIYIFNASPSSTISSQDDNQAFVCVDAISYNNYNLQESTLSNNKLCENLESDNLVVLPVNPNPMEDFINVSLISSENNEVTISLTDLNGKVFKSILYDLSIGLNQLQLSVTNLSQGSYFLRVIDKNGVTIRQLIKK